MRLKLEYFWKYFNELIDNRYIEMNKLLSSQINDFVFDT